MVAATIQFNTPQLGTIISGDTYNLSSDVPDDVSIFWNSADAIAKTMTVYSPSLRVTKNKIIIKDKAGTAGTYPITITVAGGGTIEGASSYVINVNNQSITLENDGKGNYAIISYFAASTVVATQNTLGISRPMRINGLGDSITASNIYYPTGYGLTVGNIAPNWQPSTAYSVGNLVKNGGIVYYCFTAGTSAGSGGPTGSGGTDGTVFWFANNPNIQKTARSFLSWAEWISNQTLFFDMSQGYAGTQFGLVKIIVMNGGSNYSPSDTISFGNGSAASLVVNNGVITGVNITNAGFATSWAGFTITTSTGSGASLAIVCNGSGTFGSSGRTTSEIVAFLPDAVASNVDIFTVLGGTNDISAGVSASVITANLKTIYDTLLLAGKKLIPIPILPRAFSLTTAQIANIVSVNNWIRAYARGEPSVNTLGTKNISLADPSGYFQDGTNAGYSSIGGTGNTNGAVTYDGLHPSALGAQLIGQCVWNAAKKWVGDADAITQRIYSRADGYDPVRNINGNMLEGIPWQNASAYALGALCSNAGNVYYCTQAGTSAAAPTGTGSNIVDGTVRWTYSWPSGISVSDSGTSGTMTSAGSVTCSGSLISGATLTRNAGTAAGTIVGSIENPYSNGILAKRQVLTFSLGSGTAGEIWKLDFGFNAIAKYGIRASDVGKFFYMECELNISGVTNLNHLYAHMNGDSVTSQTGANGTAVSDRMLNSSGGVIAIPNNGNLYLRSQPIELSSLTTVINPIIWIGFDCSGGAGSALGVIKMNYLSIKKAYS